MSISQPFKTKSTRALREALESDTVEGGTEGSKLVPEARRLASSAPAEDNLAEELDVALGAVCGCFAAVLRPTMKDAERTFDSDMEFLLEVLHAWKATFQG